MQNPSDPIVVPLAEGFEEIEAVTIVDVLRRAGLLVQVAGLGPGSGAQPVRGAHGMVLLCDCGLDEVQPERVRALVLPGGMPGTRHLQEDARVLDLARRLAASGRITAAICAAPLVLAEAGVLEGVRVTAHPSVHDALGADRVVSEPRVLRQGTILTSQGPGTALEFSLALVAQLVGADAAGELARAMLAPAPSDAD